MQGIFVTAPDQLDILDLPRPELQPYQALVKVEACSICNSTDWKLIEGEFFSGSFPMLLGHESVGRVIALGRGVRSFREGDRVLRSTLFDAHIPFPGGRSCWGGFVEYAIVTDAWAEKGLPYDAFPHPQQIVPPAIPPAQATALITLKETLSCLNYTDVRPGQSLAIVGSGPVAQALVCLARLRGIAPVVVFGRRPEWAELFSRLGAHAYAAGEALPSAARAVLAADGFDRAIEAVGSQPALARCLALTRSDGRINLYGIAPERQPYLPEQEADPRLGRAPVVEAEAHAQLLDWIAAGRLRLADWISHSLPWREYRRGFELVKNKQANKVVLTFD